MSDLGEFEPPTVDQAPHNEWAKAEVVVGPDGGSLSTGVLEAPLELSGDWSGVLRGFGLDPDVFEVVDDTVKLSKWQQSKGLEDGTRSTIWLYSYTARFTRKAPSLTESDLQSTRDRIAKWKPRKPQPTRDGVPCTYLVNLADLQLGKSQGGGIDGAIERIENALERSVEQLVHLRKRYNVERVMVANMGDPIESCQQNYPSQLHTVKANLREQMGLALDVLVKTIEVHGADDFLSVLSNHGEFNRKGGRQVTGDSDSADGFFGDELRRLFDRTPDVGPTRWLIPHDEMTMLADLSGVKVAFAHGHKIPSQAQESDWLKGQSIRLLREQGSEPRIWVTAHLHHLNVRDYGPWFRFQCPSLDGGSKYFTDSFGKGEWATAGLLTMLVGNHDRRGWSDLAVL